MRTTIYILAAAMITFSAVALVNAAETESYCEALCYNGSTVSCTADDECSAKNASCPSYRGSVTCDGSSVWCPACPVTNQCELLGSYCETDDDCHDFTVYCSTCTCEPTYMLELKDDPYEQRPPAGRCLCPIDPY